MRSSRVQIESGIGRVLIVDCAARALEHEPLQRRRRTAARDPAAAAGRRERAAPGSALRRTRRLGGIGASPCRALRSRAGVVERGEVGLDGNAAAPDDRLERLPARTAARRCHRCAPSSTELMTLWCCSAIASMSNRISRFAWPRTMSRELSRVDDAIAHRALLGDGVRAMRGSDERGAIRE